MRKNYKRGETGLWGEALDVDKRQELTQGQQKVRSVKIEDRLMWKQGRVRGGEGVGRRKKASRRGGEGEEEWV